MCNKDEQEMQKQGCKRGSDKENYTYSAVMEPHALPPLPRPLITLTNFRDRLQEILRQI